MLAAGALSGAVRLELPPRCLAGLPLESAPCPPTIYMPAEIDLWMYVREERPFVGDRPLAALFLYSPDRNGEHPQAHLKEFRGTIPADGYAGLDELFAATASARSPAGQCVAQVLRRARRQRLADRERGARTHR